MVGVCLLPNRLSLHRRPTDRPTDRPSYIYIHIYTLLVHTRPRSGGYAIDDTTTIAMMHRNIDRAADLILGGVIMILLQNLYLPDSRPGHPSHPNWRSHQLIPHPINTAFAQAQNLPTYLITILSSLSNPSKLSKISLPPNNPAPAPMLFFLPVHTS